MEQTKLIIEWTQMPTYNTVMSVAAGAGLWTLASFLKEIQQKSVSCESWSIALGVPGLILFATGLHMTLTWPLAKYFPFDNVIFGETSFAFGVLLLFASFYLWKNSATIEGAKDPAKHIAASARPLTIFIFGMGLALFGIATAGLHFQLFAAPPEEPISGNFAAYPWLEATAMSGLFALVGLGAALSPVSIRTFSQTKNPDWSHKVTYMAWMITGVAFLLFGALNFYTHIGLIINTMPK